MDANVLSRLLQISEKDVKVRRVKLAKLVFQELRKELKLRKK